MAPVISSRGSDYLKAIRNLLGNIEGISSIDTSDPGIERHRSAVLEIQQIVDWVNPDDPIFRQNRQEIARCFPCIVPMLASPPRWRQSIAVELEVSVDRGSSVAKALSRNLGIDQDALRYLMRLRPDHICRDWIIDPIPFFRAIGITPPARRPKSKEEMDVYRWYWSLAYARHQGDEPNDHLGDHCFKQLCATGYSKRAHHELLRMADGHPCRIACLADYVGFVALWCDYRWTDTATALQARPRVHEEFLMRYPITEIVRQSIQWGACTAQSADSLLTDDRSGGPHDCSGVASTSRSVATAVALHDLRRHWAIRDDSLMNQILPDFDRSVDWLIRQAAIAARDT